MTSTDLDAVPAAAPPGPAAVALDDWHAPPPRAVRLHAGTLALLCVAIATASMAVPMFAADSLTPLQKAAGVVIGYLLAGGIGAYIGARLRHQRWKLDDEGLWLRSGRLWRRETRVPASRVQHVDLKHGPLERRFRLATLVVHTAAVHLSGITVRGLDEADAQLLRDQLARQLDDAGDAL
ncbi:MAG TPA: PH domain-containing protein [Thermomonas sp.]|nr:PH domain-containing protein [Thermomonas sp.]